MKQQLLTYLIFAFFGLQLVAQTPNCSFGLVLSAEQANVGDTVDIAVTARQFNDIIALQYNHQWDPQHLQFVELLLNPATPFSLVDFNQTPAVTSQGFLNFAWSDSALAGVTIPDSEPLYTIRLIYLQAGEASIETNGSEVEVEATNVDFEVLQDLFLIHGRVGEVISPPAGVFPGVHWACIQGQTCGDPQTGAISVEPSGTLNFTYAWSGPGSFSSNAAELQGLQPGIYALTLTHNNGRFREGDFYVSAPSELQLTLATDFDECGGQADGQVSASLTGGSGNYDYSWSNGENGASINNVPAGNYSVPVTDLDGGCSVTGQVEVQSVSLLWANPQVTNASCSGSDGSITMTFDGPPDYFPLTFAWDNGMTSQDISGLSVGVYGLTVTGANGCTNSYFIEVSEEGIAEPEVVITNVSCSGNADGSISILLDEDDYMFSWSDGSLGNTMTNLDVGVYTVSITDNVSGCTLIQEYEIIASDEPLVGSSYTCYDLGGDPEAEVTAIVWNNNDAPYTFNWSGGQITQDDQFSTVVLPGNSTYSVTVTSASGCSAVHGPLTINCEEQAPIQLNFSPVIQSTNTGDQVCLDMDVNGFSEIVGFQYTLSWDPGQLSYSGISNFGIPGLDENDFGFQLVDDGRLPVSWIANDVATGETVPDGTALYSVCWDVIGSGPNTFVGLESLPAYLEFTHLEDGVVPVDVSEAIININSSGTGQLDLSVGSVDAFNGETVCLPVTANGFTDIAGLQFSLNWDPAILQYNSFTASDLADVSNINFSTVLEAINEGKLGFLWTDNDVSGENLVSGATLFDICFNVIGETGTHPVSISGDPVLIEAANSAIENVPVSTSSGSVTINGAPSGTVAISIGTVAVEPGESVCVPVQAEDFVDVSAMQFSINWDSELITFDGVEVSNTTLPQLNPTFFNALPGNTFMSVAWLDPNLEGVTLPSGAILFEICFTAGSEEGISGLNFSSQPTDIEFVVDEAIVPFLTTNGQIEITTDGLVWPGDTDANEIADHFDLLPIGLAFNATGPARTNPTTDWVPQAAGNWTESTPTSNVNFRHADTNGDGVINAMDTLALHLNWGLMTDNFTDPGSSSSLVINTGPPIFVQPDTVEAGATVSLPIMLGTADDPSPAAYGIAFSILYDPIMVTPGSVELAFDGWLGDVNTNMLAMYRDYPGEGRVDVALVRTDGMNIEGVGQIGQLTITMEDVIFRTNIDVEVIIQIDNVRLINYAEEDIPTTPRTTTSLVLNVTHDEEPEALLELRVSPNPTERWLRLSYADLDIQRIEVMNTVGQLLASWEQVPQQLDLSTWPAGTYFLRIVTDQGTAIRQIVKQ